MNLDIWEGNKAQQLVDAVSNVAGLISPKKQDIVDAVEDWMDTNIHEDPTVVIDASLSVEGAAADAKATGAVKDSLLNVTGNNLYTWDDGQTRDIWSVFTPSSYADWASVIVPCAKGDIFNVKGSGGNNSRLWIFVDDEGTYIETSAQQAKTETYIEIEAPANAAYLVCNSRTNDSPYVPGLIKGEFVVNTNSKVQKYLFGGLPFKPITFTNVGYLYNGSNSITTDEYAESGYIFEGFNRIVTGATNNFAVMKEISKDVRPTVLASGQSMTIALWVELANGVESANVAHVFMGASKAGWNPNGNSYVDKSATLKNGWNVITLPVVGTADANAENYRYMTIGATSISEAQKIKSVMLYLNAGVVYSGEANHAVVADTSVIADEAKKTQFAENAGIVKIDSEISPVIDVSGTATTGGAEWSTNGTAHICTFDEGTTSSGQYYARIAWDIKKLFGHGYSMHIDITNSNGTENPADYSSANWRFNEWHLSRSSASWGTNEIVSINPINFGGNSALASSSFIIDIDDAFSTIDPSDYDNIYLLVSAFKGSPSNTPAATLGIDITLRQNTWDVWANRLIGFDKNNYYTKEQINELIDQYSYDNDLLFWGDSLTAGAGGDGTTYPAVCATELGGLTYKNCGVGGETANTIAARQGGNTLMIPAGDINGQYSYTEFVDVFGGAVLPLRQGNGSHSGDKLYIKGDECTLSISQTSSTSTDAVYTISGYTGGTSVVPLPAKFVGSEFNGNIVVIFVGQNGSTRGNTTGVDARISIIDSMIAHIPHKRYVILGLSSGTESSRSSDDEKMLAKYGNKFFPTRKMLVNHGVALAEAESAGYSRTSGQIAQDDADIAVGTVPSSLRSDNVHLNKHGYTVLGKLLAHQIQALGYV